MVEKASCAPPRLQGRHRETAVLEAAVRGLAGGRKGAVVIIEGHRGAGKTTLLDTAERRARRDGAVFLRAAAVPANRSEPLKPLVHALGERGLTSATDIERCLIGRTLVRTPVVVAIDDLHQADDATLQSIRNLTARLVDHPILWLLTLTPGRADMTARALTRAGASALPIGPLDHDEVYALARDVLCGPPSHAVLDLLEDLGGYPGPIVQLLRALLAERLVAMSNGSVRLAGTALHHVLRELHVRSSTSTDGEEARAALTRSELAVAEIVALGATNRQAAAQLQLSPHTVSSHLRHAFEKLGIRSRIELAIIFAADVGASS